MRPSSEASILFKLKRKDVAHAGQVIRRVGVGRGRKAPSSTERKFMSLIKQAALTPFCRVLKTQKLFQLDRSHAFHYIFHQQRPAATCRRRKGELLFYLDRGEDECFLSGRGAAARPPKSFAAQREILYFQLHPRPALSLCLSMALGAALFVLEEGAGEVINSFLLRRRGATRARASTKTKLRFASVCVSNR
jgi:hypothetical protein